MANGFFLAVKSDDHKLSNSYSKNNKNTISDLFFADRLVLFPNSSCLLSTNTCSEKARLGHVYKVLYYLRFTDLISKHLLHCCQEKME